MTEHTGQDQVRERRPWAYTAFWVVWVLAGIAVELIAVFNRKPGDTLSEHVWAYVTGRRWPVYVPPSAAWVGRGVLVAFLGWLLPHFVLGIWG